MGIHTQCCISVVVVESGIRVFLHQFVDKGRDGFALGTPGCCCFEDGGAGGVGGFEVFGEGFELFHIEGVSGDLMCCNVVDVEIVSILEMERILRHAGAVVHVTELKLLLPFVHVDGDDWMLFDGS